MAGALLAQQAHRSFLIACLMLAAGAAQALDLGPLQWRPAPPNAPVVEIQLRDVTPVDPAAIKGRIATADAYKAAGLNYHAGLSSIEIKTQATANGQASLRLENLPRNTDALDLLVIVSSRHAFSLAEYRLDLRRGAHEVMPSLAGATQAKTNQRVTPEAKPPASQTPPAPVALVAPEKPDPEREISEARLAIQTWAQAWSRRDVVSYLGAYTPDYAGNDAPGNNALGNNAPGNNAPGKRQAWTESRRARILARKNISVVISAIALTHAGNAITATFNQRYTSDGPTSHVRKQMRLVSVNGRWLIQSETTLP